MGFDPISVGSQPTVLASTLTTPRRAVLESLMRVDRIPVKAVLPAQDCRVGFEPTHSCFADNGVTTSPTTDKRNNRL